MVVREYLAILFESDEEQAWLESELSHSGEDLCDFVIRLVDQLSFDKVIIFRCSDMYKLCEFGYDV